MWQLTLLRATFRILSRFSRDAASRLAMDVFRNPRRYDTPEREVRLMADASPFAVRLADGSRIQAWSLGEGPVVVLAHGWEGRGSQMVTFAAPLRDAGFRVVTFDAPAHGASSGRRSSLPQFADALRGVADAAGPAAAVVGHSLGCAAAMLAVKEGMPAERLVFVAPPFEPFDYTRQFGEIFGLDDEVVAGMCALIEQRFGRPWSDYSLAAAAPRMKSKLLIIHDRDDAETLWAGSEKLATLWPGARLVTTESLGHRRILRDPSVIAAAVSFLREPLCGAGALAF